MRKRHTNAGLPRDARRIVAYQSACCSTYFASSAVENGVGVVLQTRKNMRWGGDDAGTWWLCCSAWSCSQKHCCCQRECSVCLACTCSCSNRRAHSARSILTGGGSSARSFAAAAVALSAAADDDDDDDDDAVGTCNITSARISFSSQGGGGRGGPPGLPPPAPPARIKRCTST
jgi:hypothetical protein